MWSTYEIFAFDEDGKRVSYFGQTHDMEDREGEHTRKYNAWVRVGKPYQPGKCGACTSVFVMDMEGWEMKQLDEYETEQEAIDAESLNIRTKECVNRQIPGRTYAEWYKDNEEKQQAYQKKWRKQNETHLKEEKSKWYQNNKAKLKLEMSQVEKCPCGLEITKSGMWKHLKSKRHADRVQQSTSSS